MCGGWTDDEVLPRCAQVLIICRRVTEPLTRTDAVLRAEQKRPYGGMENLCHFCISFVIFRDKRCLFNESDYYKKRNFSISGGNRRRVPDLRG